MPFEEDKINNNINNSESNDEDFLDSLMQGVMGESEPESTKKTKSGLLGSIGKEEDSENKEYREQEKADENTVNSEENSNRDNGNESIKKKRRAPLFSQLGIGIEGEQEKAEDSEEDLFDGKKGREEKIESGDIEEDIESEVSKVDSDDTVESEGYKFHHKKREKRGLLNEDLNEIEEEKVVDLGSEEDEDDDDFIDMFRDIIEEEETTDNTERVSEQDSSGAEVPLDKPGMESIKVTADGKTLADMIPGLRSGNKSINKKIEEIKEEVHSVEIGNKRFSDNRYTKHYENVNKRRELDEKRKHLSNKFLQKNAKFTEQEKIIMRNLGVTSRELSGLMRSKKLTEKEKEKIIGLGKYGAEKYFKGRRYKTTVGDTAMLEFLVKFKFANTRILRWISNEPQGRTWRKLSRLKDNGLVESKQIIGVPDLWAATQSGIGLSGYSFYPGLRPMPKMATISATMGINYIAACLWFNSVNVLNLPDFPAENREIALQADGRDRVRGEILVSELEIRSSLGKEINPNSTTMKTLGDERLYDVISSNVREEFDKWVDGGKVGESPEFALGNEYMWVLYPTSQLTLSYHVPDLVVKRARGPNGEPRSIAVEMERSMKDTSKYDKIMLAYKLDEHLYEQVVWVTPSTRIARAIEQSAKNVGLTKYSIVPIITENGVYNKPDIWMI